MAASQSSYTSDVPPVRRQLRVADLLAALGILTLLPLPRPDPRSLQWARATVFFPLIGLFLGSVLLGAHRLLAPRVPQSIEALMLVITWLGLARADAVRVWRSSGTRNRLGLGLTFGFLLLKLACLAVAGVHPAALLFAPLLARWGMVVLVTGARDADAPGRKFNPGVTFSEFAVTSVFTIAVVLVIAEAVGILVVVAVAAGLLSVRLLSHRWANGVSWRLLLTAAEGIETFVVLLLAAL